MIVLTLKQFAESYDDFMEKDIYDDKKLYTIRNDERILYIGVSEKTIYERWFLQRNSHLVLGYEDCFTGANSKIGIVIGESLPVSYGWNIDLWGIKGLLEFLEIEHIWDEETREYRVPREDDGLLVRRCPIKYLESFMIRYLFPRYNSMGNNGKSSNPYFEKKYFSMVGV
jgi:hypothetical protein